MKLQPITEAPPILWEDGLLSKLEIDGSIEQARPTSPEIKPRPTPIREQPQSTSTALETISALTLSGLIASCGVAAIDGYLTMKDYATAKGLDLAEFHHKGIDLQDIISTLVIHTQKMAEMEGREAGAARRWKR